MRCGQRNAHEHVPCCVRRGIRFLHLGLRFSAIEVSRSLYFACMHGVASKGLSFVFFGSFSFSFSFFMD